ncbi:hypothetical protein XHV734_4467 [Xanthomonas hortorum pv. vitians]|nr:hypothetical protein XHV734_4467 [Xanthomonas hortorum pv. vitians]
MGFAVKGSSERVSYGMYKLVLNEVRSEARHAWSLGTSATRRPYSTICRTASILNPPKP